MAKSRITITVDGELLEAATDAVAAGAAESMSAWIARAIAERLETERRLSALASLVADYEAEHGAITGAELAEQEELDRDAAAAVRARTRRAG